MLEWPRRTDITFTVEVGLDVQRWMSASVSLQTSHYRIPLPETVRLKVESYTKWSFGVGKNTWHVAPRQWWRVCEAVVRHILYVGVRGRNGREVCRTNVMMKFIICAVHRNRCGISGQQKWYSCTFRYFVRNVAGLEFPSPRLQFCFQGVA